MENTDAVVPVSKSAEIVQSIPLPDGVRLIEPKEGKETYTTFISGFEFCFERAADAKCETPSYITFMVASLRCLDNCFPTVKVSQIFKVVEDAIEDLRDGFGDGLPFVFQPIWNTAIVTTSTTRDEFVNKIHQAKKRTKKQFEYISNLPSDAIVWKETASLIGMDEDVAYLLASGEGLRVPFEITRKFPAAV